MTLDVGKVTEQNNALQTEYLTIMTMKITISWNGKPCSFVYGCHRAGGTFYLHSQDVTDLNGGLVPNYYTSRYPGKL
jgi:hypothetical protein